MSRFGWLHLTDLHFGQTRQGPLFHGVKERFFEDLKVLHGRTGPWHVVLFSGDFVQRGSKAEYAGLEEQLLGPLWATMRGLGSEPGLLGVPGNHDLERPKKLDKPPAALRLLLQKDGFAQIANDFFGGPKGEYRRIVDKAFANYAAWWRDTPYRYKEVQNGLLPGEFSATLDLAEGARVGVVGLNTTFLQLAGGDYTGRLALDVRQFNYACTGTPDGDGAGWAAAHHACLLMTHQGFDWLDPRSQMEAYPGINPAGRFAVHLFGHMHENVVRGTSVGGGKMLWQWQGNSLFSMEPFGDPPNVERRHGYSAGTIEFDFERSAASLRHWPRKAVNKGANGWDFDRDTEGCVLDKPKDDGGTVAVQLPLRRGDRDPGPDERGPFGTRGKSVSAVGQARGPVEREPLAVEQLHVLPHEKAVLWAEFSPDGARIVTASGDCTARLWDDEGREIATLRGHQSTVLHAAYSRDGSVIVTASADRTARLWDALRGCEIRVLTGHQDSVGMAAFSPDGRRVVTASHDNTAAVWDTTDGRIIAKLAPDEGWMTHAAFGPEGARIVTAGLGRPGVDGTVRVWDAETGQQVAVLRALQDTLWHASFSPDGTRIVTGSLRGSPKVWNAVSYRRMMILSGHKGNVLHVAFSRDGTRLLTAGTDATRVWNAVTGDECARLEGAVAHAEFSPDGRCVVTAGKDSAARVWDAEGGRLLAALRGHEGGLNNAAFSPDGLRIVTASADGTALIWAIHL